MTPIPDDAIVTQRVPEDRDQRDRPLAYASGWDGIRIPCVFACKPS